MYLNENNAKKFNFSEKKDCFIRSIRQVNCFLNKIIKFNQLKKLFK